MKKIFIVSTIFTGLSHLLLGMRLKFINVPWLVLLNFIIIILVTIISEKINNYLSFRTISFLSSILYFIMFLFWAYITYTYN